ncbi:MAG TPA: hypothetical protein VHX65_19285 [Pirellulales bacterium]|jgi:hypothetical protein|nr:hypothetical protein [Pirellulales bacterium]
MSSPAPTTPPQSPRLTDSPWFWAYLFSTAGFVALLLMSGKYQHRQTHIEDEYRYGTRTLERPGGATLSNPSATASQTGKPTRDTPLAGDKPDRSPISVGPQPSTHEMLIPLGPLRVLTGIAMVVSCIALQVSYLRRRAAARGNP